MASGITPHAIENKPELEPANAFYLSAYQDLQFDRPVGMTLGPIPWSSIVSWARLHGVKDPDDIDELISIIRAVETAIFEYEREKNNPR